MEVEGADCDLDLVLKVTCRIDYNQDVCTEGKSYVLCMLCGEIVVPVLTHVHVLFHQPKPKTTGHLSRSCPLKSYDRDGQP